MVPCAISHRGGTADPDSPDSRESPRSRVGRDFPGLVGVCPPMGNARFSLPLQREARAQGEDHEAVRWLLSAGIQEALCAAAEGCLQTSLPAERAIATAKHGEQSRLCHLATRSRDLIHRAVLRKRDRAVAQLEAAERALRASKKTRIEHIAFQAYSGPTGA